MAILEKKYGIIFGLLILAIIFRYALHRGSGLPPEQIDLLGIPKQVDGWQGVDQPLDQQVFDVLGLDAYIQRKYVHHQGNSLWLYVGYYRRQGQGKGIHSPKHCYPGAGWSIVEKGTEPIQLPTGPHKKIRVNRILFQKDEAKQIVLYWFQSSDRIVHSEYAQRFHMMLNALFSNRTDGALVKISAPVIGDLAEVLVEEKEFIKKIFPALQRELSGR